MAVVLAATALFGHLGLALLGLRFYRRISEVRDALFRGEYDEAYQAIRAHNPLPSVCARVCDHKCEMHCRLGTSGDDPVAIRALKRFVTDRVDRADLAARCSSRHGKVLSMFYNQIQYRTDKELHDNTWRTAWSRRH